MRDAYVFVLRAMGESDCIFCGAAPTGNVVVFGSTCEHRVHLSCYREAQSVAEECLRCRNIDLDRVRTDAIVETGSDAGKRSPVFGAAWRAWERRAAAGPVSSTDVIDAASAAASGAARKDIAYVRIETGDLFKSGASVENLPDNAQAAQILMRKQSFEAFREWLDMRDTDSPVTVAEMLANGITYETAERHVISEGYKRSFLAWRRAFGFGGADMVALGATWEQLLETGLQATNMLSVFDGDIAPLVDAPHIKLAYVHVWRDICGESWDDLANLGLSARQLGDQLGLTAREMSMQTNCPNVFKVLGARYTIDEFVANFRFDLRILDEMYTRAKNTHVVSIDKFRQTFCMRILNWRNDDCARALGIRFSAV